MIAKYKKLLPVVFLSLLGTALLWPDAGDQHLETGPASAGLTRSETVIAAKIARKQARLDSGVEKPQHPDGYAKFRSQVRPHPEGSNVMQLLMDAKRRVAAMPALQVEAGGDRDAGLWDWDWLGPGNIGGRVRTILTHPDQPGTLWIGSAGGGIWKTVNSGASWFPLDDFLPSLAVTSLAMSPINSNVIYAGTGEGFGNGDALPGAGIFKSWDGGGSWEQLPATVSSDARFINDLACHPTENGWLIACGISDQNQGKIWRTENGGDSWSVISTTLGWPKDVKYDPDDPDVVIVGLGHGALRSDDAGLTWDTISDGSATGLPSDTGRCEIAFGQGTDVVYASCDVDRGPGADQGEIWRSLDNGVTWEQRSELLHLSGQGWYDNVIWALPGSTEEIIVGGVDLFASIDGGVSLSPMSDWREYHTGFSAHADQHAIVPHINYGVGGEDRIYIGNDGGIQIATDGILTQPLSGWINLANNLGITQFFHADVTPDGNVILGGSQDNDDLRYTRTDGAQDWFQAMTGDGTFCAINPVDQDTMYACYPLLRMQRSTDGGDSYHSIFEDIDDAGDDDLALFVSPFALDKVAPYRLVAGGQSIWLSNDHGSNWHSVHDPIFGNALCSAVEISPTQGSEVVWVGYDNGRIWKTENFTIEWEVVEGFSGSLPDTLVTDIEISPHDPATVLVTFAGYFPDRVWLTTDGGDSWVSRSGSGEHTLPEIQMNCVTFHPTNPNWIYVGSDLGMFASEDMGQTWSVTPRHDENEGPVYTEVSDLMWHSGETLVAVTHGRGMYECRPLDMIWVDLDYSGVEDGSQSRPWNTFSEGNQSAGNGSTIIIKGGDYGEGQELIEKRVIIEGNEGAVLIH
jgi:photosystem II stability/assembly factor-like uncharacterized protein